MTVFLTVMLHWNKIGDGHEEASYRHGMEHDSNSLLVQQNALMGTRNLVTMKSVSVCFLCVCVFNGFFSFTFQITFTVSNVRIMIRFEGISYENKAHEIKDQVCH